MSSAGIKSSYAKIKNTKKTRRLGFGNKSLGVTEEMREEINDKLTRNLICIVGESTQLCERNLIPSRKYRNSPPEVADFVLFESIGQQKSI